MTLDTLRADALGCYGGPPDTPFLDHLAAQGIRFEEALSACNSTLPAHTSILTGQPVPTHGVLDNRSTLAPDVRTLAQVLRQSGYLTAAAVSVEHLQPSWSGLGRGFDRFLEVTPGATLDGALTLEGVEEWLAEWGAGPRPPLFLWVHLFDPHTPYGPPPEFRREYEARLARAGVQGRCGPVLNPKSDPEEWLAKPGAPKPRLENEKPAGQTVRYEELIQAWREGRAR